MEKDCEWVAEREVECVFPDGRHTLLRLRIGKPYPAPDGDWCCRVAAEGWHVPMGPIFGVDSWQALLLAQRLLEMLLHAEVDRGATLHWPPGDSRAMSVAECFDRRSSDPTYEGMARDEVREAEALEWAEGTIRDVADE